MIINMKQIKIKRLVIQNSFGFVLGTRKRDVKLQKMDISVMFVDLFLKTRGSSNTMCESIAKQRKFTNALHVTKLLGRHLCRHGNLVNLPTNPGLDSGR